MSYRAFKRLLGETSLERKCRFLFGIGILVLITLSFWFYAYRTEYLAYDQATTSARQLVPSIVAQHHLSYLQSPDDPKLERDQLSTAMDLRPALLLKDQGTDYHYWFLYSTVEDRRKDKAPRDKREKLQGDPTERDEHRRFVKGESTEYTRPSRGDRALYYYAPVRALRSCLGCHQALAGADGPTVAEDEVLAMIKIRLPTKAIEEGVHFNRAILMGTALVTAILIMAGSWIIVRYIIVKPVKHLKEVSDAISAGELNVRSEIQTGDEFEDLSHAFNRMLRNLVSMQDRWRKVNADLDRKVDELAQANMALYETNRVKSDFLATMSHELRTPLNSILGFSDVLLSGGQLNDKQQRWVQNIQSSGQKLLNLINDILDLAKIEAGKMQVRIDNFSLHDVCEGLVAMFRPLAEKKNIDLLSQIDPQIPVLRQDVTKFQQIMQNLLSNAIKFTPEAGRVMLKADADAKHVILTVTDTGVGIAPEEQELVFQKFRQSGNPLTREHAGTGLGLSIVRELTKLLGGEVTLQSELGRGSTFTVRLPLQLSIEPRLEFDLAEGLSDLAKAQQVDTRLLALPRSDANVLLEKSG